MSTNTPTTPSATFTAFAGLRRVAAGTRAEVLEQLRQRGDASPVLLFDDQTGAQIELDLRADAHPPPATEAAAPPPSEDAPRGVGRPRLGVVAREVTLLPRHWEWLGRQPGGASVALRRLIDEARRVHADRDTVRAAREAAYNFMTAMAGNLPGFEEAARALFAGERERFASYVSDWPEDVRAYAHRLSAGAWGEA